MAHFAAIDLGATSGRVAVGSVTGDSISYEIVHRFANNLVRNESGDLLWDWRHLTSELLQGLFLANSKFDLYSVAVDSWAVDYLLFNDQGQISAPAYSYRAFRTDGIMEKAITTFGKSFLYEKSGIQFLPFNTIFQFLAAQAKDELANNHFLMLPDAVNNFLCGSDSQEITNASTTGLLDAFTRQWNFELIEALGLPAEIFPHLHEAGLALGSITKWSELAGLKVVSVGSHDTASAVAGTPMQDPATTIYISSGTWSLVGCESAYPSTGNEALEINLTNELGVESTVRNLKNVSGMWIISELLREWQSAGKYWEIEELVAAATQSEYDHFIDPNDQEFIHPGPMQKRIEAQLNAAGKPLPIDAGEIARCVYRSLARSYHQTIQEIETVVQRKFESIIIVGGGAANDFLNQLTADATGLPVYVGPSEATLLGNIGLQAISAGIIPNVSHLRNIISKSYGLRCFVPS